MKNNMLARSLISNEKSKYNTIGEYKGCCEIFDSYIHKGGNNFIINFDKETFKHFLVLSVQKADGNLDVYLDFTYCPFCGKKLKILTHKIL